MTVSFKRTKEESALIDAIVGRAVIIGREAGIDLSAAELAMDLCAANANGCPMDFQRLLDADDGTFGHDVFGVRKYINRDTGELEDCFVPRCARPSR